VVVVNADLEAAVVEALLGFGWVDREAARRLLAAVLGTTVEIPCDCTGDDGGAPCGMTKTLGIGEVTR
jgi:hypothetical protein